MTRELENQRKGCQEGSCPKDIKTDAGAQQNQSGQTRGTMVNATAKQIRFSGSPTRTKSEKR